MGRWRPPPEKSSPYITPQGARHLKDWLADLWRLRRNEVVPALSAAAAEGDRSENAEYIYRKKQLGEIDRKIRYLSRRLDEIRIVEQAPADRTRVYFGARVGLQGEDGRQVDYRIVGADETDARRGFISIDSPLARALIGRSVGDEVAVSLPAGMAVYHVAEIHYEPA